MTQRTSTGLPSIKLPGGGEIKPLRVIRFLAGIAIVIGMLAGWITPHDKIELGMYIGLALLLIDPGLITTAVSALRAVKNGKK